MVALILTANTNAMAVASDSNSPGSIVATYPDNPGPKVRAVMISDQESLDLLF